MQGVNKERLISYNRMSVNWLVDFIDVTKYKVKSILSAYDMKNFFTQIFSLSHVQTNSKRGKI